MWEYPDRQKGKIFSQDMMAILLSKTYTSGTYDPTGGDGYVRGDWADIEDSLTEGLLTHEEYMRLAVEALGVENSMA